MQNTHSKSNVLITGSTGFLGKAILKLLKTDERFNITATNSSLHNLTKLEDCIMATKKIDIIINLAGLVLSRNEQQKRPAEVFSVNTRIALNIAEAAIQNNVRKILFISSVTAYPEDTATPFSEKDLWAGAVSRPNYAYGVSKRITETIARTYSDQYGIGACALFLPNLYGPDDKFEYSPPPLVPNVIIQIQEAIKTDNQEINGGNNGDVELDFLYVTDAAKAIKSAIEAEVLPTALNISTNTTVSIKKLYETIAKKLNYTGVIVWETGTKPSLRKMDTTLTRNYLTWSSVTPFETGISNTINNFLKR